MTKQRFFLVLLASGMLLGAGYASVQARLGEPDVRQFVEAKAEALLGADVQIRSIRYLPLLRVGLKGIEIQGLDRKDPFSVVRMEELVFGFGLVNLLRRDFTLPGTLELRAPEIQFETHQASVSFLNAVSKTDSVRLSEVLIRGGILRYPWRGPGQELLLASVELRAKPDPRGRFRLRLTSKLGGIAQGKIRIEGWTDASFHHYQLEVRLDGVSFSPESGIPLRRLGGEFRLTEKTIEIVALTSLFHDWEMKGSGRIDDWQGEPKVVLDLANRKGKSPFRFYGEADFKSERLKGEWTWVGRTYPFWGRIRRGGEKIAFWRLKVPHGYVGEGTLDAASGDYAFWFQKERRRIQIHSNLSRLEFATRFELDHVSVNRLDWVLSGRSEFRPLPKRPGEERLRFKAAVNTDYFIVEYEPLEDFQGTFELGREGLDAIDFRWGGVFRLSGRILLKGGEPRQDLLLRIEGFPLTSIQDFAGRPVPENLDGILEGKLSFRGELERPEVQGVFTIREGAIEGLEYDRAIVQFRGYPPYLQLYDSKVFKGRSTLRMTGAIDLRLDNFFHGIQIKRPDHLVIWKGMSVSWKEGESAVEAEKPLGSKLAMGLEVRTGRPEAHGEDPDEKQAVLGPKVKF